MKRESKQIADRIATAIAAASIFAPDEMRTAAAHIKTAIFSADEDAREVVAAFAAMLERKAEQKERVYREAYQQQG